VYQFVIILQLKLCFIIGWCCTPTERRKGSWEWCSYCSVRTQSCQKSSRW